MMAELVARNLRVRAGRATPVVDVSFELTPGTLAAVLGPNGAGKTLSLRASLGLTPLAGGSVTLDGETMASLDPITRARAVSYLPQVRPLAWPARVRDIVALGRYAHGAGTHRLAPADARAMDRALRACGMERLAHRAADTLSGGEVACMHCARVFAAETPLVVADEPVAALDPLHQFQVMDLFRDFVSRGGGALVVLHDVGLAARYADRLIWLSEGRVAADGTVEETLTPERLAAIYRVRATVTGRRVELSGPLQPR